MIFKTKLITKMKFKMNHITNNIITKLNNQKKNLLIKIIQINKKNNLNHKN